MSQNQSQTLSALPRTPCYALRPVLDVCCGSRMMWFDKRDSRAVFVDKRRETHAADLGTESTKGRSPIVVDPDVLADFTALPFPDETFAMVVMDPPHIEQMQETAGLLTKKYGSLVGDWRDMLREGISECFRVLKPEGTLIFKWNAVHIPLREILALTPHKPLFGHQSGKKAQTHWVAFLKHNSQDMSPR